jgi:hypothetical protein
MDFLYARCNAHRHAGKRHQVAQEYREQIAADERFLGEKRRNNRYLSGLFKQACALRAVEVTARELDFQADGGHSWWIRGELARDVNGCRVSPLDPHAVSWCALGRLVKNVANECPVPVNEDALLGIENFPRLADIVEINDEEGPVAAAYTLADIMGVKL